MCSLDRQGPNVISIQLEIIIEVTGGVFGLRTAPGTSLVLSQCSSYARIIYYRQETSVSVPQNISSSLVHFQPPGPGKQHLR